jgi:SPP1 gp7 family putative phage head morphogenesis protein
VPLTANEQLVDRGIRHAVHLTRLRNHVTRDVLALLNDDVLPDLQAKLARRLERIATRGFDSGPWTTKRLREVIKTTRAQLAAGMDLAGERLVDSLREIGLTEAQWQAARVTAAIPSGLDLAAVVPGSRHVGSAITSRPFQGDLLSGWWSKLKRKAQDDIARQIQIGVTEGETNAAIVRRLAGTAAGRHMDGAFGGLRRNVASITQTATNHVSTQAREMTYEANSDLIKGVQIVATLDGRTTEICMSEDGEVYDVGDGPRPPFHFNCRTTTVPVLKSLRELGFRSAGLPPETRASMRGQVPARQTYGTWLRNQPAAVQDDVLGRTKGRLFRKHRLSVDSFVDDKRRVLTLPELRRKEGLPET